MSVKEALSHLETAETAIMSFIAQTGAADSDEEFPDVVPMLLAVMRSISRAAGIIEGGDLNGSKSSSQGLPRDGSNKEKESSET